MAQAGRLCYTKQCKDHSAFNSVSPFSAAKNFLRFMLRLSLHFDCAQCCTNAIRMRSVSLLQHTRCPIQGCKCLVEFCFQFE